MSRRSRFRALWRPPGMTCARPASRRSARPAARPSWTFAALPRSRPRTRTTGTPCIIASAWSSASWRRSPPRGRPGATRRTAFFGCWPHRSEAASIPTAGAQAEAAVDVAHHRLKARLDAVGLRVDDQFGVLRLLVGRGDAREVRDFAPPSLLVEPLRVAPLAGGEIGLHEDLVERAPRGLARPRAIGAVGRDEG